MRRNQGDGSSLWSYRGFVIISLFCCLFSACESVSPSQNHITLSIQPPLCQYGYVPTLMNAIPMRIYGELCNPPSGPTKTIIVLIPGLSYTHLYWNWPTINGVDYSAMHYLSALQREGIGYSTFSFDRPGTGQSSHPQSNTINLKSNAVVLHQIIQHLRSGELGIGPVYYRFSHIILIGHSFGSMIAEQEAVAYHDEDGLILTGELHRENKNIASLSKNIVARSDPSHRFFHLDAGYLTRQPGSLGPIFFSNIGISSDPAVIALNERVKDTETMNELRDSRAGIGKITLGISVPTLLIVGQQDAIHCINAVNCSSSASVFQEEANFFSPKAHLQVKVIPGVGHDLNLHYACMTAYIEMLQWSLAHVSP